MIKWNSTFSNLAAQVTTPGQWTITRLSDTETKWILIILDDLKQQLPLDFYQANCFRFNAVPASLHALD